MKKIMLLAIVFATACTGKEQHPVAHKEQKNAEQHVMTDAMNNSMREMHQVKQTGNADYDFVVMMIPHHAGAIAMANAVVKHSKSAVLVDFAKNVISAQQAEIDQFETLLKRASQEPSKDSAQVNRALMSSMSAMMSSMNDWKSTGNLDRDFIELMIPHHQSAVDMAKAYLPFAKNETIKKMAENIIKAQEEEINWMKSKI